MAIAAPTQPIIALIGNPNTGKSTLFNALTGLRQKVGNYPGVTVEKHVGTLQLDSQTVTLIDLPGTYSLSAQSPDEMVVVDVLCGEVSVSERPNVILVVIDASNARRNLYLASQLLELGLPVVIAMNMTDLAEANGTLLDVTSLEASLEVPVVPIVAASGKGLDQLKARLKESIDDFTLPDLNLLPTIKQASLELADELVGLGYQVAPYEVERALIDQDGYAEERIATRFGNEAIAKLLERRQQLSNGPTLSVIDARTRYGWVNDVVSKAETSDSAALESKKMTLSDRIDQFVSHPILGSLLFLFVMMMVFQSVFAWASPLMDWMDGTTASLSAWLEAHLPEGALTSLLVDGIIAGVGSVVIFLPQILILFAFIIILEDSGYMARAAFLMDRLMRGVGLSGRSFIPMLSSFACAVPGIMATRVISDRRDRIATMLAAPFMTCSARLPVYALLIAAFIPQKSWLGGAVNLQGLVLLGLYLAGIIGGILTALLLKRTILKGPTPTFLMEMPPYRLPNLRSVLIKLWERGSIFLRRAGTVIFTVAVIVWALAYFPHPETLHADFEMQREVLQTQQASVETDVQTQIEALDKQEAAAYLEQSYLGRIGQFIEPVFSPLGWDWKISAAVLAAFPAREVVIAVLGTIYALGSDVAEDDQGLISRLQTATHDNGELVFNLPMAIGLMVFFALCLQCAATLAIIRRETGGWSLPILAWTYMTTLGYLFALLIYQVGSA